MKRDIYCLVVRCFLDRRMEMEDILRAKVVVVGVVGLPGLAGAGSPGPPSPLARAFVAVALAPWSLGMSIGAVVLVVTGAAFTTSSVGSGWLVGSVARFAGPWARQFSLPRDTSFPLPSLSART